MKLNLGCGNKRLVNYVNIDHDPLSGADLVMSLGKDLFPFENNSVDDVIAHHVFEHIGDGFFDFIKDLYRVCKHEAVIDVHVPHPRHDYFLGDLTHVRPITIENIRPLSKKWCNSQSYINSSWSGLAHQLDVDFEIVDYQYQLDDTFKQIIEGMEPAQVDWMARAMNNVITEIHFRLMVIKQ